MPRHGVPVTVPLHGLMAAEPWRALAACVRHPRVAPTAFDDTIGEGREDENARKRRIAVAQAVCRNECPVIDRCARDANLELDGGVRAGIDLRDEKAAVKLAVQSLGPARKESEVIPRSLVVECAGIGQNGPVDTSRPPGSSVAGTTSPGGLATPTDPE